jgi:proline iminopeptidase
MTDYYVWRAYALPLKDLELTYYTAGEGEPLLFLNGGPGDDHSYMRPVAEPFADEGYRCVLYDQRGCGASKLSVQNAETLHLDKFLADIDALRRRLGVETITLIGHSWGATLALLYMAFYPTRVKQAVLLNMGPVNDQMKAIASANLLKGLSVEERERFQALRAGRKQALADEDLNKHRELHLQAMSEFYARGWIFDPALVDSFAADYRSGYNYNPLVAKHLMPSVGAVDLLTKIDGLAIPTLIVYGAQDFEPVGQAYILQAKMPLARVALLNECGHIPWLEQPDALFTLMRQFFE